MPIDTDHHDPAFPFDDENETDEIALPRFEERLRTRLARAHDDHNAVPSTGAASTPPGGRPVVRRGPQRRPARRSLVLGAGALAAAAAVVVAVAVRPPTEGGGDPADPPVTDPPTSELATRIIAATDEAVATSVVHVKQDNSVIGDHEDWTDETTGAARSLAYDDDGEPLLDSSSQGDDDIVVDHCFAEYTKGDDGYPLEAYNATEWVQNSLAEDILVEDGTQVVDGRELIRLREVEPQAGEGEEPGVTLVDPDTNRPVMTFGYPGTDLAYVMTYEYLPRTPEVLAQLEAQVPEGFTEVNRLRGDAESADAGCY